MRILYLTFDVHYINPTRELMIDALQAASQLDLFGPGFQSDAELERGVEAYIDRNGPYDLVVSDEFMLQDFENAEAPLRFVSHACRFDRGLLMYGVRFRDFLVKYSGSKGILLLQTDYYNMPQYRLSQIESFDYIIGWGAELIMSRDAFDKDPGELSDVDGKIRSHWSDRYRDFALRHARKLISAPHLVASKEIAVHALVKRKYDWSVVGADYTQRLRAREILDRRGLARSGKELPYLFAALYKLGVNPYAHYWSIALLQRRFYAALKSSKYSYTCGSVVHCAIRKYFEIPAAGCVLVAERCEGFEALGFQDGGSAIVAEGRRLGEVYDWLRTRPEKGQEIATSGRMLIERQHTTMARARQLRAVFAAIESGSFAGTRWRDGEHLLRLSDGSEKSI